LRLLVVNYEDVLSWHVCSLWPVELS
jgi:hypothetical protein